MTLNPKLELLRGTQLQSCINALARLRIQVFAEYPYLYAGSEAYEREYLQHLAQAQDAIVIVAQDAQGNIVGCSTGSALVGQHDAFISPLADAGIELASTFYFGESVLLPEWRGHGLGHRFFDARETFALSNGYQRTCFCAVIREPDHPQKPSDYHSLDKFWQKRGYRRLPDVIGHFDWPEVTDGPNVTHPMGYWLRAC